MEARTHHVKALCMVGMVQESSLFKHTNRFVGSLDSAVTWLNRNEYLNAVPRSWGQVNLFGGRGPRLGFENIIHTSLVSRCLATTSHHRRIIRIIVSHISCPADLFLKSAS